MFLPAIKQEQADPINALAPMLMARQGQSDPFASMLAMNALSGQPGGQQVNPLALMALTQQGGQQAAPGPNGYPHATVDDGDPRRGMFPTGQSSPQTYAPTSDMGSMIVETANSMGMDPVDLATIISYETGGTFDPTKRGPTTQWGQHRGLIQFGEPQAKQYGVDWNNPTGSQLGPNGAVAKYFKANGYEPGMGILDAYSIVNAGGPGLYNRSDANNGGAPGTVRDKVETQMAGHRAAALRLLGM